MRKPIANTVMLMSQVQSDGCVASFRHLYDATSPLVLGTILRVNRDRTLADDILQEVYLRAWCQRAKFDPEKGNVFAWLIRIGHNLAVSSLRRSTAGPKILFGALGEDEDVYSDVVSDAPGVEQILIQRQAANAIRQEMDKLHADQRDALRLCFFEDFSHSQLAERRQLPLGTVKSQMRRLLASMRPGLSFHV